MSSHFLLTSETHLLLQFQNILLSSSLKLRFLEDYRLDSNNPVFIEKPGIWKNRQARSIYIFIHFMQQCIFWLVCWDSKIFSPGSFFKSVFLGDYQMECGHKMFTSCKSACFWTAVLYNLFSVQIFFQVIFAKFKSLRNYENRFCKFRRWAFKGCLFQYRPNCMRSLASTLWKKDPLEWGIELFLSLHFRKVFVGSKGYQFTCGNFLSQCRKNWLAWHQNLCHRT